MERWLIPRVNGARKRGPLVGFSIKRMQGCKVSMSLISRLAKKCNIYHPMCGVTEDIRVKRNAAWSEYARLKSNSR